MPHDTNCDINNKLKSFSTFPKRKTIVNIFSTRTALKLKKTISECGFSFDLNDGKIRCKICI